MSGTSPTGPQGQHPYGQDPDGRAPQDSFPAPGAGVPAGPAQHGQSPYGQNPYGQNPYGQSPYGQDPYGGSPYAAAPQQPHGAPTGGPGQGGWPAPGAGPGSAPRRPGSLTAAFWLILSGGLVLLGSTLLAAFALSRPESRALIEEQLRRTSEEMGLPADQAAQMEQMTEQLMPIVSTVSAVFGVVAFLLYLLIASKIRGGSRAARTVGTVLAALSVLMVSVNLAMGAVNPLDLVWVGLGVAGIVMAYRPDATEYMRLKAWERAGAR